MTELKKFLDAKKSNPRLIGDLERHLMARPLEDRSTTVLHPSEMVKADWCLRASYFALTGVPVKKDKPNLRLQSIFDEGHSIHAKWQNWFQEMGVLYGKFQCQVCGMYVTGTSPACQNCSNLTHMVYKEITLVDKELNIAGHTDGWVKGIGDDCLIEIKSIGAGTLRFEAPELLAKADGDLTKAWRSIRRPFGTHIRQGQMYLELAKRMFGDDAPKEIVFLYELKADQDYREFTIKADYEFVEPIFEKAKIVVDAVAAGTPLECTNRGALGCKQCLQFGDGNDA
jgi:hypothetical protein